MSVTIINPFFFKNDFAGGNQSHGSLYEFGGAMAASTEVTTPTAGGTLTINSQALGSYDYIIKRGDQTISSFTNSDWFTTTADTRSACIAIDGNLTINSGVTFIPSNRKLFTFIYVTGNLTLNGTISMDARGASHSGTTANAIRLITGTYSGISNPQVPASGGAGATAVTSTNGNVWGNAGTAGTSGGSGGGGGGGIRNNLASGTTTGGAGSGGTAFSGGSGGGGAWYQSGGTGGNGAANGGAGGNGTTDIPASASAGGGAGNSGGSGVGPNAANGSNGTGGIVFIVVKGTLSGSGTITAAGTKGGEYTGADTRGTCGGGGSGGGSVTAVVGVNSWSGTISAAGGAGGAATGSCASGVCSGGGGGAGGAGTARILVL